MQRTTRPGLSRCVGFTLIELMLVLAVVAATVNVAGRCVPPGALRTHWQCSTGLCHCRVAAVRA